MFNVAVAGLGWWGRTIVPLLKSSDKMRVVRALDPDPAAAAFASLEKIPFSGKLEEAVADPNVQGVVLCTPHTLHTEQVIKVANAKKHVFCDKPLSLTREMVLKAVKACNDNRVVLAVGHEKRFEPPIQEALRLVKSGELGEPLQIEANFVQDKFLSLPAHNWRLNPKEAPAGPLTATGIHLLDLSVGVFGAAKRVFCYGENAGKPSRERRHAGDPDRLRQGARAAQRLPRHAVRWALRGLLQQGLGGSARQGASVSAAGMDADEGQSRKRQGGQGLPDGRGGACKP